MERPRFRWEHGILVYIIEGVVMIDGGLCIFDRLLDGYKARL